MIQFKKEIAKEISTATEIEQNEIENDNVGANESYDNINNNEHVEDVTKYGEFVSSYFSWLPPEKQKKRAKEIDDMTK